MSKDNDNLRLIRSYIFKQQRALRAYVSTLPDSGPLLREMMGTDNGKSFVFDVGDHIMAKLGHPVKTKSASEKAWEHVYGN